MGYRTRLLGTVGFHVDYDASRKTWQKVTISRFFSRFHKFLTMILRIYYFFNFTSFRSGLHKTTLSNNDFTSIFPVYTYVIGDKKNLLKYRNNSISRIIKQYNKSFKKLIIWFLQDSCRVEKNMYEMDFWNYKEKFSTLFRHMKFWTTGFWKVSIILNKKFHIFTQSGRTPHIKLNGFLVNAHV